MEILKGNSSKDIMEIIQYLGKTCLEMVGIKNQKEKIKQVISDGSAYEKFLKMVYYHGGKIEKINFDPQIKKMIIAKKEGYLNYFNTKGLGMAVINLGGGRKKIEDSIDSQAGFKLFKKHGELIQKNEPIAEIFCSQEDKMDLGEKSFNKSIKIVDEMPKKYKLIY